MYSLTQTAKKAQSAVASATPPSKAQVAQVTSVAKDVEKAVEEVKAGYKTSEFWLHLAAQALVWGVTLSSNDPTLQVAGVSVSGVLVAVYTFSRTYLKGL